MYYKFAFIKLMARDDINDLDSTLTLGAYYYDGECGLEKNPLLAIYYFEKTLTANPEKLFREKIITRKQFVKLYCRLAECYLQIGDTEHALYYLEECKRIGISYLPDSELQEILSIFYVEEAIQDLKQVLFNNAKFNRKILWEQRPLHS